MRELATCPVCGGRLSDKPTVQDIRHGQELMVIENVPAAVCEHCGEELLSADVMKRMDAILARRSGGAKMRSLEVPVFEFDSVQHTG